jgi:hypothetical protein
MQFFYKANLINNMPVLRSIVVFILEFIFVTATISVVASYMFKDILQKSSLSEFIKTNLIPQMVQEQCDTRCQQISQGNLTTYNTCMPWCKNETQNNTQNIDTYIDQVYSQKIYNMTLGDMVDFLNTYFIPLIILTIISGVAMIFLSYEPFSRLGHALISIAITLLILGLIPNFVTLPSGTMFQTITSYILKPLEDILIYGIVALISGIGLSAYGYYSKKKAEKKK